MKKSIFILIIILVLSLTTYNVNAHEIEKSNLYYFFTFKNNNGRNFSDSFFMYVYDHKTIAYCIEPGVRFGKDYYLSNDISMWSNETKERIEDLMFFGYLFDNHYEEEYYMATQVLIWKELLNEKDITISTNTFGKGDILNIDKYINDIENTITRYKNKKNDFKSTNVLYGSKDKLIIDKSFYFNNMKIEAPDMFNVERTDTGVKVSNFDEIGTYSIKYYLGYDHLDKYAIYKSDDGQDLLLRGNLDKLLGTDEINIVGGELYLSKLDRETNEKLDGSIYGLYDINNSLLKEIPINDQESAYINDLLVGTYYLKELVSPEGYMLDDTVYTVVFDDEHPYYNILLFDDKIAYSIDEEIEESNTVEELKDEISDEYNLVIEDVPNTNKYDYLYLYLVLFGVYIVKKIY